MRFSIQTPQYQTDPQALAATWRVAERLGFRSAWLMDHLYPILAPPTEPILEAWTTLAALARETTTLRLGVLVTANTLRPPALLARMAATVDHLSAGRLEVGLGAAWCEPEHVEQGIAFPPLAIRLGMLSEACRVLRGLWREQRFSFDGRHYRLRDAACAPKPLQDPLPLLLGGQGEHKALAIVARHADLWNISGSADTLRAKHAVLVRHCEKVGRDPGAITVTVRNDFLLTDDSARAARKVARFARHAGLDKAEARRRMWVGSADEVVESLRAFADAGCDEVILGLDPPYDAATQDMLARMAEEIVPRLAP